MAKYHDISVNELRNLFRYEPKSGSLYRWVFNKRWRKIEEYPSDHKMVSLRKRPGVYCSINIHILIWALYYGEWPTKTIDHINGIRGDNRIKNLRDVSLSINC